MYKRTIKLILKLKKIRNEGKLVKLYNNIFSVDVFYKSYHFIKGFNYYKIVINELACEFID